MNTNITIYFDMDGTIANLYAVENWLSMLRSENPLPYKLAEPMVNVSKLNVYCGQLRRKGVEVGVITWLSKESSISYEKKVIRAKQEWLKKYFPACGKERHMVSYGVPKVSVVEKVEGNYLIDDEGQNGRLWESLGGIWINPKTTKIEVFLKNLLREFD